MPRPGNYSGPDVDPVGAFFDFRSNVFYNWGRPYAGYNADKATLAQYVLDALERAGVDQVLPHQRVHLVDQPLHVAGLEEVLAAVKEGLHRAGRAGPALKGKHFANPAAGFHVGDIFTILPELTEKL